MSYTVIIPARYGSSRLPGKPLADIAGKPMIVHVYERCLASQAKAVWVATDDERIAKAVEQHGGKAIMTAADHPSGTDRLQEVAQKLGLADEEVVVNVQGDEPLIPAAVIDQVAQNLLQQPNFHMSTLCEALTDWKQVWDANVVKAVFAEDGRALYFSRAPIPWQRDQFATNKPTTGQLPTGKFWRHIGIYGYRVSLLNDYIAWPQVSLEAEESLEQLRALYYGAAIHIAPACATVPAGVDTPDDLAHIRQMLEETS
ncbi:MAG TPA: 3-deoxy-manno-octulosonate cytidylyltransferase [Alcanivoracaceae bacterium]|nr:3-deoxy-manno-octulosonate cytidylyltransferase [Alcanivoracaceae bacterium]